MAATRKFFRIAPFLLVSVSVVTALSSSSVQQRQTNFASVCEEIENTISNASDVFYPLQSSYTSGISHWATSSSQNSACVVEPGTADDVGKILQVLAETNSSFAVKGGGHTMNLGFSSTEGVHVSMTRFDDVTYNADTGMADIGTGLVWDTVYDTLANYNVNVVGGRVPGVGVAGFTLGGGYSWLTNQYGLTVDTVQAFELVLPNGTVTTVTSSNEDLFFALKGGFNNFGIVTKLTLKTFPQSDVWGGLMVFTGDQLESIANATVKFANNYTDPKAAIITELNTLEGLPGITLNMFYDGPEPPAGIFDDFLNTPYFSKDVQTRSFTSLIAATPSAATGGLRGVFHTVSVANFSSTLMSVILDQVKSVGSNITSVFSSGAFLSYEVEPFSPSLFSHGSGSAYPPSRDKAFFPLNIYYAWILSDADDYFHDTIKQSQQVIENAALAEGQDVASAALYGNYAITGTDLESIYGDNVSRLKAIKATYDPDNVMSLAGGWKF